MLVWFQVNIFRIRVGKKDLGHIMTHIDTVCYTEMKTFSNELFMYSPKDLTGIAEKILEDGFNFMLIGCTVITIILMVPLKFF